MITGKVVGNVWSTRKDERLDGLKFLIVKPIDFANENLTLPCIVASDTIGAGINDLVLVVKGSSARTATSINAPIDASIVGIIDDTEISKNIL